MNNYKVAIRIKEDETCMRESYKRILSALTETVLSAPRLELGFGFSGPGSLEYIVVSCNETQKIERVDQVVKQIAEYIGKERIQSITPNK